MFRTKKIGPYNDGFSLVEALVGFAILTLVLGAFFQATSASLAGFNSASKKILAIDLAKSQLAFAVKARYSQGFYEGSSEGLVWKLDIEDRSDLSTLAGQKLMFAEIAVYQAGSTKRLTRLETFFTVEQAQ